MRARPQSVGWALVLGALLGAAVALAGRTLVRRVRGDADSKAIFRAKIDEEWSAFKNRDARAYGDMLSEDFLAVEVDAEGTRNRDQAMREVERSPVNDFALSRLDVRLLGDDAAMVTYEASMQFRPPAQVPFLRVYVSEVWIRKSGAWKALHYQETRVR